jgi:hypothetical protein
MQTLKLFVVISGLMLLSNCVMANPGDGVNDPVLIGSVSDAVSKKPVKGVTICIQTSKDKACKSFTTDASGKFSIPKLPSGEVTIVLEKKGYKTYRKERIVVKEGTQMKLNFDISNDTEVEDNNLFHPLLRMMES